MVLTEDIAIISKDIKRKPVTSADTQTHIGFIMRDLSICGKTQITMEFPIHVTSVAVIHILNVQ